MKTVGNQKEAENCRKVDEDLLDTIKKHTEGKSISKWKTKVSLTSMQKYSNIFKYVNISTF